MNSVTVAGVTYTKDSGKWIVMSVLGRQAIRGAREIAMLNLLKEQDEALLKCVTTSDGQGMENIRLRERIAELEMDYKKLVEESHSYGESADALLADNIQLTADAKTLSTACQKQHRIAIDSEADNTRLREALRSLRNSLPNVIIDAIRMCDCNTNASVVQHWCDNADVILKQTEGESE